MWCSALLLGGLGDALGSCVPAFAAPAGKNYADCCCAVLALALAAASAASSHQAVDSSQLRRPVARRLLSNQPETADHENHNTPAPPSLEAEVVTEDTAPPAEDGATRAPPAGDLIRPPQGEADISAPNNMMQSAYLFSPAPSYQYAPAPSYQYAPAPAYQYSPEGGVNLVVVNG